jgi:serine/threonine-protein kinase
VQEITTTANLQHPHILPLFDSGEADGFLFYVMPYIEGETLRDKLNRESQLSIDEAVKITTEVADALDYAHRSNVIHRDIKPENILLHDGRAMVADFGIALAVSAAAGGRMTETGLSLGTPHYMSPEQATAEKDLTNRSDIYSLGTVLYELLAGAPPHLGGSAQQIIMKIVTDEARPITELRKSVPPHVAAATAKSLEKLAADRFESAAKFAEALTNPAFTLPTTQAATVGAAQVRWQWNRLSVTTAALAAIAIVVAVWALSRPEPLNPVVRYGYPLPEVMVPLTHFGSHIALAPDDTRLVYVGVGEGGPQLFVRDRSQLHATPLPGTEGAESPFFSPDGGRVGFWTSAPSTLNVISLGGGPPTPVADSGIGRIGASWGSDGFLYTDGRGGIARVPASGGVLELVTVQDTTQGETEHWWPDVLPNGKGVLFTVQYGGTMVSDIAVGELETGAHRVLVRGVYARYTASGHLLYVTADGTLMIQPFDQDVLRLTGEAVAIVEGLSVGLVGAVDLAVSSTGTLMYVTATGVSNEMVWVTRDGTAEEIDPGWTGNFRSLALSPDGTQLAVSIFQNNEQHIWVKQLDRGPLPMLTSEGTSNDRPAWTPDGRAVTFSSNRDGASDLHKRRADGSAFAELLLRDERLIGRSIYSEDGAWLVYVLFGRGISTDIHAIRPGVDSVGTPLLAAAGVNEQAPALSPNGRWLAYVSDESGRFEVYVVPFPNADAKWPVSSNGGTDPVWSHSGRELFYKDGNNELITAEVVPGTTFAVGEQRALFSTMAYRAATTQGNYGVTADAQRFVMIRVSGSGDAGELIVVENFFEELKAKVGN